MSYEGLCRISFDWRAYLGPSAHASSLASNTDFGGQPIELA